MMNHIIYLHLINIISQFFLGGIYRRNLWVGLVRVKWEILFYQSFRGLVGPIYSRHRDYPLQFNWPPKEHSIQKVVLFLILKKKKKIVLFASFPFYFIFLGKIFHFFCSLHFIISFISLPFFFFLFLSQPQIVDVRDILAH